MIRIIIAVAMLLATSITGLAQLPPNDSAKYSLVVLTRDIPCPQCVSLVESLSSPDVAPIVAQCNVFAFTPRSKIYQLRYADAISPDFAPTIALIRSDGGVIYKASGSAIPRDAQLAADLRKFASLDRQITRQPVRYSTANEITRDPTFRRPRLIPDTVVVRPTLSPTVNVAAPNIIFLVIGGLILLVCAGIGLVIIVSLGLFFLTR